MFIYQVLLAAFAISIPIIGLVAVLRLAWCAYQALRGRDIRSAALSVLGIVFLGGLFAAVLAVWFGYGVAHSKKDIWTDLTVIALTGVPFYAASFALWRLAGNLLAAAKRRAVQPGLTADVAQAARH
jgi:hypothetical protein